MTKKKTEYTCKGCGIVFPAGQNRYTFCSNDCQFWSKVEKTDTCWNWIAGGHKFGYGEFRAGKVLYRSHRYSYEIHKGHIPDGLGVNHTCDNPRCVNPDHLYAGTAKENVNDALARDRFTNRLLTKEQVLEIKTLLSETTLNPHQISKLYKVYPQTIYHIRDGKSWSHI